MDYKAEIYNELEELLGEIQDTERDYLIAKESKEVTCDFSICYDRIKNLFELVQGIPNKEHIPTIKELMATKKVTNLDVIKRCFEMTYFLTKVEKQNNCHVEFEYKGKHYKFTDFFTLIMWLSEEHEESEA